MEISISNLLKIKDANIIDIRSSAKYSDNHIPFAVNIPYNKLISNPSKYLNKYGTYYIYCQKGITSKDCVNVLRAIGFNAFSIIGGYEEYIISIDNVYKSSI